jgi:hypothetical protein
VSLQGTCVTYGPFRGLVNDAQTSRVFLQCPTTLPWASALGIRFRYLRGRGGEGTGGNGREGVAIQEIAKLERRLIQNHPDRVSLHQSPSKCWCRISSRSERGGNSVGASQEIAQADGLFLHNSPGTIASSIYYQSVGCLVYRQRYNCGYTHLLVIDAASLRTSPT